MTDAQSEDIEKLEQKQKPVEVSAREMVGDDKDRFEPEAQQVDDAAPANPASNPPEEKKNLGGRPKGSKDKVPRKPVHPERKKPASPASDPDPDFSDLNEPLPPPPPAAEINYDELAKLLTGMSVSVLIMTMGPEWQFQNEQERTMINGATANYIKSKKWPDLPPGLVLCLVALIYAAPRMRNPNTATKVKYGWLWVKGVFGRMFFRKKRGAAPVVAKTENVEQFPHE